MELEIKPLDNVRLKVCSSCQLNCYYCHKEGFHDSKEVDIDGVSVALSYFKKELGIGSLKISGGEPTNFNKLPLLVSKARKAGFNRIAMTTNGLFDKVLLNTLKQAGLTNVHFSLRALNPEIDAKIQQKKTTAKNVFVAKQRINNIVENILLANKKFDCAINTPVTKFNKGELNQIANFCSKHSLPLRLLKILGSEQQTSLLAIGKFIKERRLELVKKQIIFPTSDRIFEYADGSNKIFVKDTLPFRLFPSCLSCRIKNACIEGAYGIRLESNPLKVRLCLQKNTAGDWLLPFEEFRKSKTMEFLRQSIS